MGKEAPKIRSAEEIAQQHGVSLPAAKIARNREIRSHLAAVKKVVAVAQETALGDHEIAAQAGLGDVTLAKTQDSNLWGTGRIGADTLGLDPKGTEHPGVSPEFKSRAGRRRAAPRPRSPRRPRRPNSAAVRGTNPQIAQMIQKWNAEAKELKEKGAVGADVLDDIKIPEPEKIMGILKAGQQLRNVEASARKAKQEIEKKGPTVAPFVIDTNDDVDAQTVAAFKDEASVRAARALLSKVEKEDGLTRHVRNGAFDTLNEAGLTVGGREVISRDLIDFMGVSGAAQVLAHRLRANLSDRSSPPCPRRLTSLHTKTQQQIAEKAVQEAETHLDAAKQIELDTVETPVDVVTARSMNEDRLEHIQKARQILGDSYGRLHALGTLALAMKTAGKDDQPITIDLGNVDPKTAITAAHAFGLNPEAERAIAPDYRIDAGTDKTMLILQPRAINKLSSPFDAKDVRFTRRPRRSRAAPRTRKAGCPPASRSGPRPPSATRTTNWPGSTTPSQFPRGPTAPRPARPPGGLHRRPGRRGLRLGRPPQQRLRSGLHQQPHPGRPGRRVREAPGRTVPDAQAD
jgi:hypothetical protein